MKKLQIVSILVTIAIFFAACESKSTSQQVKSKNPNLHTVVVKEVVQSPSYTYVLLEEENAEYWSAIGVAEVVEGKTYYYDNFIEMNDFTSKELDKTFETIYFINELSEEPILSKEELLEKNHTGKVTTDQITVTVTPVEGGITIGDLFKNKVDYSEKIVKVTGQVTKVNTGIMGKNWIHIQDGTSDGTNYDLTITTDEVASVGDIVIFEGKISLNKDFGYGYAYDVLLEDAKKVSVSVQ